MALVEGLGKGVKIHGPLPQEELATIMKQCHIFVLPSFFEGLPLVLLEALACGCRLVSTALPGVLEVTESIDRDLIRLVELPRLHGVDRPVSVDERRFEEELERAIEDQIHLSREALAMDVSRITRQISSCRWSSVFNRVEGVYLASM